MNTVLSSLRLEEITTMGALEALRPEWDGLWERCGAATPFQSPEWLLTWWRHFGGNMLWVLALRNRGRLAGLAPLFIHPIQEHKKRQVSFIGAGITDYLDFLIEPEIADAGTRLIMEHLALHRSRWDICDFRDIRPGSPLLHAEIPGHLEVRRMSPDVCPVLPLPATVEEFYAGLPTSYRIRVRRAQKAMAKYGDMRIETADEDTFPEFLDALFRLHQARWLQRNLSGVLSRYDIQAFHWDAAAGLLKRGCLRLYVMRKGEITAAALYAFAYGSRVYCYLGGFAPEMARLSPGTVIMGHAIEDAIRSGRREFDFLRGKENYKYVWGAKDRVSHRLVLWHSQAEDKDPGIL